MVAAQRTSFFRLVDGRESEREHDKYDRWGNAGREKFFG